MRTAKEVKKVRKTLTSIKEQRLLDWVLETCSKCDGNGTIGGCESCGEVLMCNCDGSVHLYGRGCD